MEIRTPVLTLKGLRPGPLDDGGVQPAERRDFIIPDGTGQAPSRTRRALRRALACFLHALVQQRYEIDVPAVDKHAAAFDAEAGDQDAGQCGVEHRDELA